jgi:MFS family permease
MLPFLGRRAGIPVATIASMVAIGFAPKVWRVVWAPVADLRLTLKAWYRIGAILTGGALLALGFVPVKPATVWPVTALAFLSEAGSSLVILAIAGLIATALPDGLKGRAAGFLELGGTVGRGLGGGAGLWLAVHAPTPRLAPILLGLACIVCMPGVRLLAEPHRDTTGVRVVQRFAEIGRDVLALVRSPHGALVVALVLMPFGVSGVTHLWSGLATEWRVSANAIALVTGALSAVAGALGCLVAGWWADRTDRRIVYLASGGLLAGLGLALAVTPRTPGVFAVGALAHYWVVGMCDAAFSALVLGAVGRRAAATKFMVISSIGNVPAVYMTAFSGWVHDRAGTTVMLEVEAVVAALCVGGAVLALRRLARSAPAAAVPDATGGLPLAAP